MRDIESYYNPFRADNTKEQGRWKCVITLDRRKSDTFRQNTKEHKETKVRDHPRSQKKWHIGFLDNFAFLWKWCYFAKMWKMMLFCKHDVTFWKCTILPKWHFLAKNMDSTHFWEDGYHVTTLPLDDECKNALSILS